MTKSDLFKAAHKIARQTKEAAGSYRIAFACALRDLYAGVASIKKSVIEILEDAGCEHWERGEMDRIYINRNAEAVRAAVGYKQYSNGKWYRNDEDCDTMITSAAMQMICGRAFYDCKALAWDFSNCEGARQFAEKWLAAF